MDMKHVPAPAASNSMPFSCPRGFGWEASSCSFAESLSVRASTAGPKTVARSFALLRFETLALTLFAILSGEKNALG